MTMVSNATTATTKGATQHTPPTMIHSRFVHLFFLLSAFLQNFFLHQDRLSGDVPPHLAQSS